MCNGADRICSGNFRCDFKSLRVLANFLPILCDELVFFFHDKSTKVIFSKRSIFF